MTRDEANAHISGRFNRLATYITDERGSFMAWTEKWRRVDGADATADDVRAFEVVPRGQGHSVSAAGAVVTLRCELDSGD